jgi:hypothetical protein
MTSGEATWEQRENFGSIGGEIREELYRYVAEMLPPFGGFNQVFIEFTGSGRGGMGRFCLGKFPLTAS